MCYLWAMSNRSDLRRAEWADPLIRQRRIEGVRAGTKRRYERKEEREASSERMRKQLAEHPEMLEKAAAARRETWAKRVKLSKLPEYSTWDGMISRCKNKKNPSYKDYGGRGIKVAPEWCGRGGFARFLNHIGRRPSTELTIDRIDNSRGYEPGNVRWATRTEQSHNSRRVRLVNIHGVTLPIAEWARRIGVAPTTLSQRIALGHTDDQLVVPPRPVGRKKGSTRSRNMPR